ncbi:histidinol-phosphatase [Haloferax sp. Atlit-10N]|uniref:CehA/McbA family metallohydrolase n=1 Tax=unclassified Haloferax TaxID=2625095 RepID=UPI000E258ECC|nr:MULTISPECIES: PHP domain-containing protein [unclassified Haloferax]RDZ45030.1 histidinol-phosphatase [Haloferax sp. Atlit-16N]RDZ59193.1 histidinol-phosphatase [Haloferax sp. Atlit-10N]
MSGRTQSPREARTLAVDLHVHTDASYDCEMSVEAVLARAAAVGLDAVAITDHDSVGSLPRAFDIAHEYGVRVVPGVEVSTADGHLLALGVDDPPATGRPLSETARAVRESGGLAVVPHPFQTFRHGASRRAIRGVDAVEVYNAHTLTGFRNGQARRYARREDLPGTGGSDAHRPALVGQAYTAVSVAADGGVTTDAILAGVRAGRTVARGTRTTARQYLRKYALNARLKTASFL